MVLCIPSSGIYSVSLTACLSTQVCCTLQDSDEVVRIAQYYEQRGEPEKAADMWVKAAQPVKAVQLYVQVGLKHDLFPIYAMMMPVCSLNHTRWLMQ